MAAHKSSKPRISVASRETACTLFAYWWLTRSLKASYSDVCLMRSVSSSDIALNLKVCVDCRVASRTDRVACARHTKCHAYEPHRSGHIRICTISRILRSCSAWPTIDESTIECKLDLHGNLVELTQQNGVMSAFGAPPRCPVTLFRDAHRGLD